MSSHYVEGGEEVIVKNKEVKRQWQLRKRAPAMKLVKATLKQQQEKSKMATLNQEIQHRINLYHLADPGFAEGKSAEAPVSKEVLAEKARKRNARVHFRIRMEEKLPIGYTHRGQIPPILDTRTDSGFTPEQRLSIYSKHHKCAHGRAFNWYEWCGPYIVPSCDHQQETIIEPTTSPCPNCRSITLLTTRRCGHNGFMCHRCKRTFYPSQNNSEISCHCSVIPPKQETERQALRRFFATNMKTKKDINARNLFATSLKQEAGVKYSDLFKKSDEEKRHDIEEILNAMTIEDNAHPEGGVTSVLSSAAGMGMGILTTGVEKIQELVSSLRNWFRKNITETIVKRFPTFGKFWLLCIEVLDALVAVALSMSPMELAMTYYCLKGSGSAKCVALANLLTRVGLEFCSRFLKENSTISWLTTVVAGQLLLPLKDIAKIWKTALEGNKDDHYEGFLDVAMAFVYGLPTYLHRGMIKTVTSFVKEILPLMTATKLISDLTPKLYKWLGKLFGFWVDDDRDWLVSEMKDEESPINKAMAGAMSYRIAAMSDDPKAKEIYTSAAIANKEASDYIIKEERVSTVTARFLADCDKMLSIQMPPSSRQHEPFCVRLYGPPGVGKSRNLPVLFGPLVGAKTKEEFDQATYARGASEYWDGVGKRPIIIYDDFGSNIDTETDLKELLLLVSASPFMPNFANIIGPNPKGMSIDPKVVICCSNIDKDDARQLLDKEAVARRFHLSFESRLEDGESQFRLTRGALLRENPKMNSTEWMSLVQTRKYIYDAYALFLATRTEGTIKNNAEMEEFESPALIRKEADGSWTNEKPPTIIKSKQLIEKYPYTQRTHELLGKNLNWFKKDVPSTSKQEEGEDIFQSGWSFSTMAKSIASYEMTTFSGFLLFSNLYASFYFLKDLGDCTLSWWKKLRCLAVPAISGLLLYVVYNFTSVTPESATGQRKAPRIKFEGGEVPVAQKQVQKNFVRLMRYDGASAVNGLMVGGTYMLTVEHAFLDMRKNSGYYDEGTVFKVFRSGVAEPTQFNFSPADITKVYRKRGDVNLELDLVLYKLPITKFPSYRNIVKRFWDGGEMLTNTECVMLDHTTDRALVWRQTEITSLKQVNYTAYGKTYRQTAAQGTYDSQPGSCGGPILKNSDDNAPIIGIHIARNEDYSSPLLLLVTKEMLLTAKPELGKIIDVPALDNKFLSEEVTPQSRVVGESLTSIGKICPPVHQNTNSDLRQSTLFDEIFVHTTEPSVLSPFDRRVPEDKRGIDLLDQGIKKISCPNSIPREKTKKVTEDMKIFYRTLTPFFDNKPLDLHTALSGSHGEYGVSYIKAIDLSTSPGFPFVQQGIDKDKLFLRNSPTTIVPEEKFMSQLLTDLTKIYRGTTPDWIFMSALKDERRPIEKVRVSPKTRMFTVCPVVMNILCKQLYGPFMARLMHNKRKTYYAGGIDRLGISWHYLIHRLGETSNQGHGSDIACHDGRISADDLQDNHDIMTDGLDLSIRYSVPENYPLGEEINALGVTWREIAEAINLATSNPYYAVRDEIILAVGTLASGLWSTQLHGSLNTEKYKRCAWNDLVPEYMSGGYHFEKYTDHAIMGDDNISVVVRSVSKYFNGVTFANWCKEYGIEVTSASKNGEPLPVEDLTDLVFLKNKTGYLGGFYCPLMEKEAAVEQINWIRKCKHLSPDELTEINVNNALRALFFYGEEEFTKCRSAVLKKKPHFKLVTYNTLYTQYAAYGHFPGSIGEELSFGDYINEADPEPEKIPVSHLYNEALLGDQDAQKSLLASTVLTEEVDVLYGERNLELDDLSVLLGIPVDAEDEISHYEMNNEPQEFKCQFCNMKFGTRNRFLDHCVSHQDRETWKHQLTVHDTLRYAPVAQLKVFYRELQDELTGGSVNKTHFVNMVLKSSYSVKAVFSAINTMLNAVTREQHASAAQAPRMTATNETALDIGKLMFGKPLKMSELHLDNVKPRDVYELLVEALDEEEGNPEAGVEDPNAGKASATSATPTVEPTTTSMSTSATLADPTSEKQTSNNQEGFTLADKGTADLVSVKAGVISKTTNNRAELSMNDQAWSLMQMLQKWQQVKVIAWTTTQVVGVELYLADVIKDLITSNFTGAPFQAFDNFRCAGVRIRAVIVGSKFHQGRAVLGFFPGMVPLGSNPFEVTMKKLIEIGSVFLDPSQGGEQELYIPFRHPKGFLNLLANDSLGSLHVRVLSQLKAAAGASTDVAIRLFFCLDQPEFKIPRANTATFKQMNQALNILGKSHGTLPMRRVAQAHPESGVIPQVPLNKMPREGAYIAPVRARTADPQIPHFGEHDDNLINWGKRYRPAYKDNGTISNGTAKWWHIDVANLMGKFWQLRMFALHRGAVNVKVVLDLVRDMTGEFPAGRVRAYLDADRLQPNKAENVYDGLGYDQPIVIGTTHECLEFQIPQLSINGALMNAWVYVNQTNQAISDYIDKRTLSICLDHLGSGATLKYFLTVYVSLSDEFGAGVFLGIPQISVNQTLPGYWGPTNDEVIEAEELAHPEMMSSLVSKGLDLVKERIVPEEVISSVLGAVLDKPAIAEQPIWIVPKRNGFFNFATGPEQIDKLTLHPAHQQLCDEEHFGSNQNELSLSNFFNRPSLVGSFTWKSTDAVGSVLVNDYVGPLFDMPATASVANISIMSYIASKFAYWRGGITLVFDVVTSAYHEGRLDVTYHPNIDLVPATYDARVSQYATSVTIRNTENCFAITFPYLGETPWKNVFDGRTVQPPDSSLPGPSFSNYFSGTFALSVGAPLRVPNNVAQEVEVLMYALPAMDFEVSHRTTKNMSLTEKYLG